MSLIKLHGGKLILDAHTYKVFKKTGGFGEPKWSTVNPDVLYYLSGNQFRKRNIRTDQDWLLHSFSEGNLNIGPWEGNISVGDKYVVLTAGTLGIVYDIANDVVIAKKDLGSNAADWISISQSGDYVIASSNTGQGVNIYDRNLNFLRKVFTKAEHGDIGYDTAGNEVHVQVCWPLAKATLNSGQVSNLIPNLTGECGHLSMRAYQRPGWALKSDNGELYAVKLDGSGIVQRFAHERSTRSSYDSQTKGVISPDGSKVMWNSDWGGGTVYAYVAEMPGNSTTTGSTDTTGSTNGTGSTSTTGSTTSPPPTSMNPVAHYVFDESSGVSAADVSGGGNTVSFNGGASLSSGMAGNALNLNGTDGIARLSTTSGLNLSQTLTIAAWINPSDISGLYRTLLIKGDAAGNRGFGLNFYNGNLNFVKIPSANVRSSVALTQGVWQHVAVTWNASVGAVKFYKNGVLAQTATDTTPIGVALNTDPMIIGSWLTGGSYFAGRIDDLRVYNRALADSEIATLGAVTPPAPAPPLADTTAPSIPSGLTATATSATQINLAWSMATDNIGVVGYRVYRGGSQIATTATPSYSNTGLTPSTGYSFTVAAYDAAGNVSGQSSAASVTTQPVPDTAAPSVPGGVTATVVSQAQINLAWSASTDNVGVTGYRVYRSGTQIGTSTTPSYSVSGLTAGTSYSFTVVAYDAAGNVSGQSGAAGATTQAAPDTAAPTVPGSLTATAVSQTQINLAWSVSTDNVGVVGYKVYRGGSQVATTTSPAYSQTGLTAGTIYSFTVAAYDAAGNTSGVSAAASATTQSPPPPPAPAGPQTIELSPSNADSTCNEEFETTANSLRAGDTLVLHGGNYSQSCARVLSNLQGTAQQPIVIRAATGETPVLTRPVRANADYTEVNLELANSAYVTIQGLTFHGGQVGIRLTGSNRHITIENSEIAGTGDAGVTATSGDTDVLTLRHNQIHHTGLYKLGPATGQGIALGCANATCRVTNSVIEQNYVHDLRSTSSGGNDGIVVQAGSGGNVLRHNVIHTTTIGTAYPCLMVYGGGSTPNTVEGNVMWQCGEALVALADAVVRNNIVLQSNTGLASYPHEDVPVMQNVSFVNNTVYGHAECASLRWSGGTNMVLANNALYCGMNVALYVLGFAASGTQVKSNYVEGTLVGVGLDGTRFLSGGTAAGSFMNPAALDFWPQAGSLLRNTADTTYLPAADFNGLPRTASRDVGAYATKGLAQNVGWRITSGFKVLSADGTAPSKPRGLRVR